MSINKTIYIFFLLTTTLFSLKISAQEEYQSVEELTIGAQTLFDNEEYVKAFPLYSQLLSLDNANPELNYRFGVCLLYADRSDTYAPIKYLKKAMGQISDPELYYHLAFAYHINYYFPAAISHYETYKQKAGRKVKKSFDVDRKIEMCRNGMNMMRSVQDLFVLQKSEVSRDEFFRSYDLHDFGSRIIKKPEDFQTKEDKKQGSNDFIFFNPKSKKIYYSAYGGSGKQKDIYFRSKTPEGQWSKAEALPQLINTIYDEDYPVMMPDGKTLYFSSKGHNTIGGYDIFKAVYNPVSKTWSAPENVNFPFNTPLDDILFISDTLNSTAWFASVRNSVQDKIMVYKVGIIKRPEGSTDLAAIYERNKELTEDDIRRIKQRARLDVNISSDEYEDIPVAQKDPIAAAIKQEKSIDEKIQKDLEAKQAEGAVIDSAKALVDNLDHSIDAFDSLRQSATSLASGKRIEANKLRDEVKRNMKFASQTTEIATLQKLTKESNIAMGKAEKLDYEAGELDAFANYTSELIHEQRLMFGDLNKLYGDAEGAAVQGDITKARLIVGEMNTSLQAIPQLPELIEKFDVNGGGLVDIQYPSSIQDPEEFVAFVLTDDIAAPSIETYSSNYDEYLPQEKNDSQIEEGEQATPESLALKIGQYVEELNEQASSLNVQITNQQGEIDRVKSGFSMIPEGEKEEQLLYLNDLITEQAILETHAAQAQEASQKLHDDYQQELNSSSNPEEKEANYQNLISTAEEVYNFKKKIFISTSPVQAAATYQMNINGDLEEKSNEPKGIIPAAELSFNQDHSDQIETQMTQMMSQLRTDTKQNNFTVKKIDQQIESLNIEAENAFTQAVSYVEAAKSARLNKREQIISQANEQFNIAGNKKSEADALAQVKEHILAVNEESQQIVQQLSDESEQLQSAIKNENWGEVESLYTQAEQSFEQAAPKLDFSDEIDSETGKLNQNNNSISVNASEPIIAYELSNSGEVKKAIGNSDSEWASIDDFSDELNRQDKDISLSLSPELQVSASSKQNEIVSIVRASDSFYGGDIELLTVASLTSISSSSTPLVKNALLQVDSLQVGAKQLIEKRNAINQYYQETIRKAAALEDESLSILRKESLTVADVELANSKNIERNSLLFKASQAANIINSYEARILAQTNAISKGVYAAEQIEIATKNNNIDKAQSENNQFQNEIAQLNKQVVDDSQFDYANAVIITEAPAVIQSKEYQEYVIEGGVIQRNNQENLKQFFADNSTDLAVDLSSSDLIISSNANTKITEIKGDNTNQAGVLTQIDNQSEIQNNSSQNNNSEFANNDDNSSGISNNAELSNSNSSEIANPNLTDNVGGNETGLSNADNFESNNANTLADISNENTANAAINNNPTNTKKYIEAEPVAIQAYSAKEFKSSADIDQAVKEINTYSQAHTSNIGLYSGALVVLAEQKLKQSNAKSLEAETATDATIKKKAQLESKDYLNQALAIKALADEYSVYEAEELKKQELIVNSSSQIEQQIKSDNLNLSKKAFAEMQKQVNEFGEEPKKVMEQRYNQMIAQQSIISRQMDSAYSVSQELANESVKLLSDASEIRSDAEGKKNAFKRRKQLKKAHDMEIKATELQNKSEKALTLANNLYQQKQQVESLALLNKDFENLLANPSSINPSLANSSFVYAGIESRKQEVIEGHLSTTVKDTISVIPKQLATNTDDIHVFERETYKAQMITEELELIKREIALISQSNKSGLSEKEIYVLENNVKLLRSKTDSLEYQAKKAFEYANSILATLSEEEQKKAKGKNRNFDDYLQDLKKRIELLLSEASSLKQRAQRSNNLDTRKDLYDQAKQKEEVAMYLILEEFEVIAQKNKTRYRKNQLILQQALMESASLQERDLMKSIFSQIDDYFNEAQQKREKANAPGISFNMRKILLQDAYSLEMKALDLQQQAKTMLDEHDMQAMLAYQVVESKTPETAISQVDTKLNAKDQNAQTSNTSQTTTINNVEIAQGNQAKNVNNSANQLKEKTQEKELSFAAPANGIVYKIQFSALQEIKPIDFFKGIPQITAQRVPNSNFIRYFSGSFTSIDQAMIRRNSVRASGYPDAFIKSWKNGEEVTLLSLRENTQNANISLSAGSASQAVVNNIDFSATNISSLQGVYYSVQVGVYSRPRTSAMIHGVSPLYHKRMKNGYWIYYSGIYKTIADATNRKNEIIQQGVKDAFIVAFSDGQTVSFSQARQDIKRGLSAPQEEDIVILEDASLQIDSQWNIAQVDAATQIANNVEGMVYKIQIGVYSNPVNLSWITSQLDDGMQMETFQNEQGKYVFSVGWFASIDEAKAKLSGVRDIVPDAFVIGFKNGKKVYVR